MTLDEAIAHAREVALEQSSIATELSLTGTDASEYIKCKQEHEQLAEWLEELKAYRQYIDLTEIPEQYKLGFQDGIIAGNNKAIDDFAEKVKEMYAFTILEEVQLEKIAEQLKAGGENG